MSSISERKVRRDKTGDKRCKRCDKVKSYSEFNKHPKAKDGHQAYCRDCSKAADRKRLLNPEKRKEAQDRANLYYENNKNKVRIANGERYLQNKLRAIAVLGSACQECGENHPAALQFHHRDPATKKFVVGSHTLTATKKFTWEMLLEEINKCDLLCANCHSKHHSTVQFVDGRWKVLL